ncbi:hypothetical protein KGF57_002973 [Candida theae]|uniref:Uncharacterized protein n=1 Tax=Candida theae TaxID=1198502 RepID=A0AAD5BDV5_9ASCO|nr:uncharacterized protein KGF57_002973 [Candida theae]KAI5957707.1 hypothetical protein KGF57_002973 [Candida theae]
MTTTTATRRLPFLPQEILDNILLYLMNDEDTMDYLENVPELTSMIINYRRPMVEVSKYWTGSHAVVYSIEKFFHERTRLNYRPKVVESDITTICQILDSGVDLSGIKFKVNVAGYNTDEQVQRAVLGVDIHDLNINRGVGVRPGLKHLGVKQSLTKYPKGLETLRLGKVLPQHVRYIPKTLHRLELTDVHTSRCKLPTSIRELRIEVKNLAESVIDVAYLDNLRSFEYKGCVTIRCMSHLSDMHLPKTIESVSIQCSRMLSLNGIEVLTNLQKLVVIDCPDLVLFFTPVFPATLTHLEFSFKSCQQRLMERNRVVFQIPGTSSLEAVRFVYDSGAFLLAVEDEFQLPTRLRTLILKNHQGIYFGPKFHLPNLQTLVVEKIYKLNSSRLMSGLANCKKLNRLTLKDSGIESMDDVKFPSNLTSLDLSRNLLSSMRNTNLKQLKYLQSMDLYHNRFTHSGEFDIPLHLQRLMLWYNKLQNHNFAHSNLTWISFEVPVAVTFSWKSLPSSLKYITMQCDGQCIGQVPDSFQRLRKLIIYTYGCPPRLKSLDFAHLPDLYTLELSNVHPPDRDLVRLPASLVHLHLQFYHPSFASWPEMGPLENLKTLFLSSANYDEMDLNDLPPSLEVLSVAHIQKTPIHGSIQHSKKLRVLDISQALVEGVPPFVIDLPQLEVLHVNTFNIASDCADFINCPNIQLLSVSRLALHFFEGREAFIKFVYDMVAKCHRLNRVFLSDEDAEDDVFEPLGELIKPQLGYRQCPEKWCN